MKKFILSVFVAIAATLMACSANAANPKNNTVSAAEIVSLISQLHDKVQTVTDLSEQIKAGDSRMINEALTQIKLTKAVSKKIKSIKGQLSSSQYSQYLTEMSKLAQVKSGIIAASKWIKE